DWYTVSPRRDHPARCHVHRGHHEQQSHVPLWRHMEGSRHRMKKIPLKTLPDPRLGDIVYQDVLGEAVRPPLDVQRGASIEEMRQSIRVLDAIDAANGTLDLEDSDYQHLKQKLAAMQWNVVDRRLVQLVEDVEGA